MSGWVAAPEKVAPSRPLLPQGADAWTSQAWWWGWRPASCSLCWPAWEPFGICTGIGAEASSPVRKSKGASRRRGWGSREKREQGRAEGST